MTVLREDGYSADDLRRLETFVDGCQGLAGLIVEVGSWEGRSTAALANRCSPETVHAVDTWQGNPGEGHDHVSAQLEREHDVFAAFQQNMQALTRGNVVPHQVDCFEWLSHLSEPVKFCHIDGSHDYDSVRRTIGLLLPRLVPGGVLCGHDYATAHAGRLDLAGGVERAVREMLPNHVAEGNVWWYQAPCATERRLIYDCFLFNNEFEVLELRLLELGPVVDRFVLVESTRTFTGRPKQLSYERFQHAFSGFASKIVHVVVRDSPGEGTAWDREYHQRNAIVRGLSGASEEDVVMISDIDEIPRREIVEQLRGAVHPTTLWFGYHYYWLNCRLQFDGSGVVAMPKHRLRPPQAARLERENHEGVPDAGWHFAYLGGTQRIRQKLRAFAHTEYDRPPYNTEEWIDNRLSDGQDLFEREDVGFPPTFVDLENSERYSDAVRQIARKYPYLVRPAPGGP